MLRPEFPVQLLAEIQEDVNSQKGEEDLYAWTQLLSIYLGAKVIISLDEAMEQLQGKFFEKIENRIYKVLREEDNYA